MKLVTHVPFLFPRNDCIHCCYYIGSPKFSTSSSIHNIICTHPNPMHVSNAYNVCPFKRIPVLERLL